MNNPISFFLVFQFQAQEPFAFDTGLNSHTQFKAPKPVALIADFIWHRLALVWNKCTPYCEMRNPCLLVKS